MKDVPQHLQTLPAVVDYRAKCTPDRVFAVLPRGDALEDGFYDFTYADLAKAVDATAWWLDGSLGSKPAESRFDDIQTVPYVGPDDVRYILICLAAMKTGRTTMLPFPANTAEGLINLLRLSNSTVVLAPQSHQHIWDRALEKTPAIRPIEVPDIEYFIHDRSIKPYPYTRTYVDGIDDCAFSIQTSGTTGRPKPIKFDARMLHDYVGGVASHSRQAEPDQKIASYDLLDGTYCPNFLPISWLGGLAMVLLFALMADTIPILSPQATAPKSPTADHIIKVSKLAPMGPRNGILLTPDILRHLVGEPEGRECLRRYEWVAYAGAPLDYETGDAILAMGVRVQSFIGSTDTGLYNTLLNDPQDWKMHRFPDNLNDGYYLEHYHDDLYELVVKRQEKDPRHVFVQDPDMDVFHCRDLWRAVPHRTGFYMNAGRVDDFIKLSTMTKFNAVALEQTVDGHKNIAKCLIAGDARPKPFIIVEPAESIERGPDVLGQVWAAVQAANEHLLPDAHLQKSLVLVTDPDRPILRTAKGTVQRRATLEMYEEKIEGLYARAGYEAVAFKATGEAKGQESKPDAPVDRAANGHVNGHVK